MMLRRVNVWTLAGLLAILSGTGTLLADRGKDAWTEATRKSKKSKDDKDKPDAKPSKLADHGKDFRAQCKQLAEENLASDTYAVTGADKDWLFYVPALRHLGVGEFWGEKAAKVSKATKADWADPLPAIVDFDKQMKKLGVRVILLPVPPKAVVYPDKLSAKAPMGKDKLPERVDYYHQLFYRKLAEEGVEVLDIAPALIAARADDKGDDPVYCRTDSHWGPRACRITAEKVAALLGKEAWAKGRARLPLETKEQTLTIRGNLAKRIAPDKPVPEQIQARLVYHKTDAGNTPVQPDETSPVLVMGDSHTLVFHLGDDEMHAKAAGLPDQLAAELGFAVDLNGTKGSGATPVRITLLRQHRADPKYLANKKVILWCFTAREFTETRGWREVPVVR